MAYVDLWNLYHEGGPIKPQVAVACAKSSLDILDEDPGTTNHAERVKWALEALGNADGMATKIMWGVIYKMALAANMTPNDVEVQAFVEDLVNHYAVLWA